MRGFKAKLLRFLAYGPKRTRREHRSNDPTHREYKINRKTGQIINVGQRAVYLAHKKRYKAWVRGGRVMQDAKA